MAGVMGVLGRQVVRSYLLTGREPILDPKIFFHFPVKYLLRILHAAARQIFAFRYDADADHVVMLRDWPEPTLLRNHRDGCLPFVNTLIALRAAVVGPDRHFVERGIGL